MNGPPGNGAGGLAAAQAWLRLLRLRGSLVAELPAMEGREFQTSKDAKMIPHVTHERNRGRGTKRVRNS